jgi:hypothetical protein
MNYTEKYQAEQKRLVKNFIKDFLFNYPDVKEVTTPTQRKNGTIMFEVTAENGDKSKFASYKSGMVRRIIRTRFNELSCYQLNPQRKAPVHWVTIDEDGKTKVNKYDAGVKRVLITNELTRLTYLKEFLIKNEGIKKNVMTWEYVEKVNKDCIVINGVTYKKI